MQVESDPNVSQSMRKMPASLRKYKQNVEMRNAARRKQEQCHLSKKPSATQLAEENGEMDLDQKDRYLYDVGQPLSRAQFEGEKFEKALTKDMPAMDYANTFRKKVMQNLAKICRVKANVIEMARYNNISYEELKQKTGCARPSKLDMMMALAEHLTQNEMALMNSRYKQLVEEERRFEKDVRYEKFEAPMKGPVIPMEATNLEHKNRFTSKPGIITRVQVTPPIVTDGDTIRNAPMNQIRGSTDHGGDFKVPAPKKPSKSQSSITHTSKSKLKRRHAQELIGPHAGGAQQKEEEKGAIQRSVNLHAQQAKKVTRTKKARRT